MEPDAVLYGFPGSLCSQKVRLVAMLFASISTTGLARAEGDDFHRA